MTQQNVADRIGVTRQTVNAIDAAKDSPTLELALRITAVMPANNPQQPAGFAGG